VIQQQRDEKRIEKIEQSLDYLGKYFDRRKFDIEWNTAEILIQKLWNEWNIYRQGQS
jgi:hypothetical protein